MTQPDVALTDYGLALECSTFAYLLRPGRQTSRAFAILFIIFFLSIALAAAAGGTVHGFYEDPAALGSRALWSITLIAIGVTALAGTRIAADLHFEQQTARWLTRAAAMVFVLYCVVVLFLVDSFLVAILDYLPVVLFLGWAFLAAYRQTNERAFRSGFIGVCMMLVAVGVQQAKLGINTEYFNHNAVYHVIQAWALLMIFITARHLSRKGRAN